MCINKVDVNVISHGITQDRHAISGDVSLDKAEVIFLGSGVLNELSRYFDEDVTKHSISIKDLLYNIPCVHRTYVITYSSATELFIPINKLKFIRDDISSKAWIQFSVESRYVNALKYAPKHYKRIPNNDSNECVMRKENSRFQWDIHSPITERLNLLSNYHSKVRKDVHYI